MEKKISMALVAMLCATVLVASPVMAKAKHAKKALKSAKPAITAPKAAVKAPITAPTAPVKK